MAQRFGASSLHQRDSRSALFEGYTPQRTASQQSRRQGSSTPTGAETGGGYGYGGNASPAYPGTNPYSSSSLGVGGGSQGGGFRPATPNRKGQYNDAVLSELESQNDAQVEGIMGKVRTLKHMTVAIGDEIRDSSALAEKMNNAFDSTTVRLRGTMNRMLLMAQKTGIGWRVWLAFFAVVSLIFVYVWLF